VAERWTVRWTNEVREGGMYRSCCRAIVFWILDVLDAMVKEGGLGGDCRCFQVAVQ